MSSLALYPKFKAFDPSTGAPLAGGKLYTYAAGTTTAQSTYADSGLVTPNANPVILDANGEAVMYCGALSYKFVLQKSDGTAVWTVDNYGPNLASNQSATPEWITYTGATIFVNTTTFQVTGADATGTFTVGRRVRSSNTAGTVYGTVSSATFSSGNTNVVLINDGTSVLDSGFSAPAYGIVSYANPSYLSPASGVSAHLTANATGFASATQITGFTTDTDLLSEFSSGTFTAKYKGTYLVDLEAGAFDSGAGVVTTLQLLKNNSGIGQSQITSTGSNYFMKHVVSRLVSLNPADTLTMTFSGGANTTIQATTPPSTLFNVVRIR